MFSAALSISDQDLRETQSARGGARLGQYGATDDGRVYRYGKAGAVALDPGKVMVAAAAVANHVNRTSSAAYSVNASEIAFALGATSAAENLYADGYLNVNDEAGEGVLYKITGHAAVASSGTITVQLKNGLKVALTTSSNLSLYKNSLDAVIIAPGAVAHQAVGVPNVNFAAAAYGWFQVGGYCSVLSDGIITKGAGAILSDAVNGAVEVEVAGTVTQRIGTAIEATVDTEYYPINLRLG